MTTFKVGDRVRFKTKERFDEELQSFKVDREVRWYYTKVYMLGLFSGKTATITKIYGMFCDIDFDERSLNNYPYNHPCYFAVGMFELLTE